MFEEIIGAKSAVWKYFRYDKNIQKAKCIVDNCDEILSAKGRSRE